MSLLWNAKNFEFNIKLLRLTHLFEYFSYKRHFLIMQLLVIKSLPFAAEYIDKRKRRLRKGTIIFRTFFRVAE